MKTTNRKNIWILAFTLAVIMLGFGMVIPVFPFYIESMGASGSDLGLLTAISPFMQLIFAPIWGEVSDRKGRRPVLFIGVLGYGISMLFFGLATQLWMLFVARGLGAILSAATLPSTYAYISDSTSEDERGGGMGMLGAAVGLGMILGPGLGGWLAAGSLSTPFFITAGLSLVTLLLILLFLPESLPAEARRQTSMKVSPSAQLRQLWQALLSPIGILLFMAFLVSFGLTNFQAIFGLYALKEFGYDSERVGWILTAGALVSTATQGALTGPVTKRWGEATVIKVTLLASAAGFILLLLANSFVTVLLTTCLFTLPVALLRPAVISLTSKQADTRQGMAMGLNSSFTSLGRIVGPIWAGFSFDVNYRYPYLSGAVILFIGFLISLVWVSQEKRTSARRGRLAGVDSEGAGVESLG
jgi:DHA1 family multidrug resistance protein-like MFS transporter